MYVRKKLGAIHTGPDLGGSGSGGGGGDRDRVQRKLRAK
jgi:hypothetical protein